MYIYMHEDGAWGFQCMDAGTQVYYMYIYSHTQNQNYRANTKSNKPLYTSSLVIHNLSYTMFKLETKLHINSYIHVDHSLLSNRATALLRNLSCILRTLTSS